MLLPALYPLFYNYKKNQFGVPTVGVARQHHTYAAAMSMTRVVNEDHIDLSAERMACPMGRPPHVGQ
jgi:hypothetical protein